jgi:hypothetical protein
MDKIKSRRVGDTTPIEFELKERGRKLTIPAGAFLWLRMRLRGGADVFPKRALTAVEGETSAFYVPLVADVAAAGVYEVEVYGTFPGSPLQRQIVCDPLLLEIEEPLGTLDFTHV